jgi:hypothetical protein
MNKFVLGINGPLNWLCFGFVVRLDIRAQGLFLSRRTKNARTTIEYSLSTQRRGTSSMNSPIDLEPEYISSLWFQPKRREKQKSLKVPHAHLYLDSE